MGDNPFAVLGLPARAGLTDDEVRAAWRRLAAATHPDRADGGDPARFAAAAAAYTVLRTRSGRGEALADRAAPAPRSGPARPAARTPPPEPAGRAAGPPPPEPAGRAAGPPPPEPGRPDGAAPAAARLAARIRGGRPARLLLRTIIAVAVSLGAAGVAGGRPATPALIVGALTWLLLTARRDVQPPP